MVDAICMCICSNTEQKEPFSVRLGCVNCCFISGEIFTDHRGVQRTTAQMRALEELAPKE